VRVFGMGNSLARIISLLIVVGGFAGVMITLIIASGLSNFGDYIILFFLGAFMLGGIGFTANWGESDTKSTEESASKRKSGDKINRLLDRLSDEELDDLRDRLSEEIETGYGLSSDGEIVKRR